jgi:hypothetical protein
VNRRSIWRERCGWLIGHAAMVAETWCLAVLVEVTVRWVSFATILERLARHAGSGKPIPIAPSAARRAVRMAFAFLPFECTCLRESLILCRLYRRRHHHVELRIGVQIENGLLQVHAWVEDAHGTPITESFGYFPLLLPLSSRRTS